MRFATGLWCILSGDLVCRRVDMLIQPRLVVFCALLLAPAQAPAEMGQGQDVISLADSLAPLQARFNADKDKIRVVALLSPT